MNIGNKIKEARLAKKMTQDELAKQLGISKNAISNYENGVSTPKLELLVSLMNALGVDANYIYGTGSGDNDSLRLTPPERSLILAYRRADTGTRAAVEKLLDLNTVPAQPREA